MNLGRVTNTAEKADGEAEEEYVPVTSKYTAEVEAAAISKAAVTGEGEEVDDAASPAIFVGDLNGDGGTDIAMGAKANDRGDSDAGAVYLIFGVGL